MIEYGAGGQIYGTMEDVLTAYTIDGEVRLTNPAQRHAASTASADLAQTTGVRGTVAPGGPDDLKLGRLNRFKVGWTADIPITIPSGTRIMNRVKE